MNKYVFIFGVCFLTGCHQQSAKSPTNSESSSPPVKSDSEAPKTAPTNKQETGAKPTADNFDAAGNMVASGTRKVWNASKQAYEYVTSDEVKDKASQLWQQTKKLAVETKQAVQEKINQ